MTTDSGIRDAITQVLADYCWTIDSGDGAAWAALWTEDGAFTGIPDPVTGRDQLTAMANSFGSAYGGKLRHHISNLSITPSADGATADARAYSVLTSWFEAGALASFSLVTLKLVKQADGWKIKSLHADMSLNAAPAV